MSVEYNIEKWQGRFKSEVKYILAARTVHLESGKEVYSDWQHIGDYPRKGDAIAVRNFIEKIRKED